MMQNTHSRGAQPAGGAGMNVRGGAREADARAPLVIASFLLPSSFLLPPSSFLLLPPSSFIPPPSLHRNCKAKPARLLRPNPGLSLAGWLLFQCRYPLFLSLSLSLSLSLLLLKKNPLKSPGPPLWAAQLYNSCSPRAAECTRASSAPPHPPTYKQGKRMMGIDPARRKQEEEARGGRSCPPLSSHPPFLRTKLRPSSPLSSAGVWY